MISGWQNTAGVTEYALALDRGRAARILVLPAWFDEGNKLRRLTVEVMRRLDKSGFDTFLPDLPGCNESLAPLEQQTVSGWNEAAREAATFFAATHVLTLRAGALVAPQLPGWLYAPTSGSQVLRGMLRARTIAAHEAGRNETRESLLELGRREGLELAGHKLGPGMIAELEQAEIQQVEGQRVVPQADLGGGGLWLRAEPGFDAAQADALAAIVSMALLA